MVFGLFEVFFSFDSIVGIVFLVCVVNFLVKLFFLIFKKNFKYRVNGFFGCFRKKMY